ncbi:hypothetical protein R1flu_007786 [Riccia fluitans]|uniref:Uncharacterized protein n=1 Tax=Riccia fluitans TaxID=41844 RepID=A0ABD1Z407_9MARC
MPKESKEEEKISRPHDSSNEDSNNSSEDEERRPQRKDRTHKRPDKKERNPLDQLVKDMAELKVHIAAPKEKRKEAKALRHDLWCSFCHN